MRAFPGTDVLLSREGDVVGHVLAQQDREIVRFPAYTEADETHVIDMLAGPRIFTRRQGEPLHPACGWRSSGCFIV